LPDWNAWTFRSALQELMDFGYVESPGASRGRLRRYTLTTQAATLLRAPGITLLPVGSSVPLHRMSSFPNTPISDASPNAAVG
jgi:hypothetical protein